MKKNQLIQYHVKIKTQTPLHIGSGQGILKKYQYLYNRNKQEVCLLDERKWISLIGQKGLWNNYMQYVLACSRDARNTDPNLYNWVRRNNIKDAEIQQAVRSRSQTYVDKANLNDIHPLIAQHDGTLYIPGSSIKGFIRSAILHHIISQDERYSRQYWNDLKREMGSSLKQYAKEKNLNRIINAIEEKALLTLQEVKDAQANERRKNKMSATVMRGILISDAICTQPRSQTPTIVVQKIDVSPDKNMNEKPEPIFRECISPGTEFSATITLDTSMTSTIGIDSFEALQKILNRYINFAYAKQHEIFGQRYQNTFRTLQGASLVLGGGTGFHTKTLIRSIAPDEEEARRVIVQWLDTAFHGHTHSVDHKISPRKLKITHRSTQAELMGLCSLTEA